MARKRSLLGRIERDVYLADRTRRDIRTYQRGGLGALAVKLLKRRTRRTAARKTDGWL
jgi:hypothetical protein